jgi:endogenous inhibitor of DNA gyrase (YacG/DUF329 family)
LIDLGAWASEAYRVPVADSPDDDAPAADDDEPTTSSRDS